MIDKCQQSPTRPTQQRRHQCNDDNKATTTTQQRRHQSNDDKGRIAKYDPNKLKHTLGKISRQASVKSGRLQAGRLQKLKGPADRIDLIREGSGSCFTLPAAAIASAPLSLIAHVDSATSEALASFSSWPSARDARPSMLFLEVLAARAAPL